MANKSTERGIHVLKQWERHRALEYPDGAVKSKGFGHSEHLNTVPFDYGIPWTEEYAHDVLVNHDLPYYAELLRPHLKVEVPDTIWDVSIDLSYNKGVSRLVNSELWTILHDGQEYNLERFCEASLHYAIEAPNKITGVMEEKRGLRWRRIAVAGLYMQDRFPNYL